MRTTRSTVLIISVTSSFSPVDPSFPDALNGVFAGFEVPNTPFSTRLTRFPGDTPVSVTCLVWKAFLSKLWHTRPGSSILRSFCRCGEGQRGSSAPCGTATAEQETGWLCRGLHRHLWRVANPLHSGSCEAAELWWYSLEPTIPTPNMLLLLLQLDCLTYILHI